MFKIVDKMSVFDQLAVARKLSPAIPVAHTMINGDDSKGHAIITVMMLGMIDDNSYEFIKHKCLSLAKFIDNEGKMYPLLNKQGVLMYQDITLDEITNLIADAIKENLGDFLNTALSD